jgi:glyoxylase-like metal-dependent hydrolase (beta-lactamase superfamily II)
VPRSAVAVREALDSNHRWRTFGGRRRRRAVGVGQTRAVLFDSGSGTRDISRVVANLTQLPGHTPTSVALFDAANRRLFIGDFVYPTTLYAFLPGASLSAYQTTARMLLETPATGFPWNNR